MARPTNKKRPKYAATRADWYLANKEQILEQQRRRRAAARQAKADRLLMRAGWVIEGGRLFLTAARAEQGLTLLDVRRMLADLEAEP